MPTSRSPTSTTSPGRTTSTRTTTGSATRTSWRPRWPTCRTFATAVDAEADELAETWFAEHDDAIKGLPDERQQDYREIRALATTPQRVALMRPRTRIEDYQPVLPDGDADRCPAGATVT